MMYTEEGKMIMRRMWDETIEELTNEGVKEALKGVGAR